VINATHLQLDGFLTVEEHDGLLAFVRDHEADLVTSTVNPAGQANHAVDDEYRRSRVLYDIDPIRTMFDTRLEALLPHVRKELGLDWFALDRIETQMTAHGDGDFFRVHTDSGGPAVETRMVTFVYYFALRPDAFKGGDLRVFDNVERDGYYHPADTFTTVEPRDNSVVFFPSTLFHEVLPVRTSGEGLDRHRFTVNGWFHQVSHDDPPTVPTDSGAPGPTAE
jgi:Rps23 Pro-64 3,4-dihydroxylase Tpa1-like proline 4-hydroxylase